MNIGKVNKILKEKFKLKEWENKVQDTRKQPVIPTSTIFKLKVAYVREEKFKPIKGHPDIEEFWVITTDESLTAEDMKASTVGNREQSFQKPQCFGRK